MGPFDVVHANSAQEVAKVIHLQPIRLTKDGIRGLDI